VQLIIRGDFRIIANFIPNLLQVTVPGIGMVPIKYLKKNLQQNASENFLVKINFLTKAFGWRKFVYI
jgi:hypothetical protein